MVFLHSYFIWFFLLILLMMLFWQADSQRYRFWRHGVKFTYSVNLGMFHLCTLSTHKHMLNPSTYHFYQKQRTWVRSEIKEGKIKSTKNNVEKCSFLGFVSYSRPLHSHFLLLFFLSLCHCHFIFVRFPFYFLFFLFFFFFYLALQYLLA